MQPRIGLEEEKENKQKKNSEKFVYIGMPFRVQANENMRNLCSALWYLINYFCFCRSFSYFFNCSHSQSRVSPVSALLDCINIEIFSIFMWLIGHIFFVCAIPFVVVVGLVYSCAVPFVRTVYFYIAQANVINLHKIHLKQ